MRHRQLQTPSLFESVIAFAPCPLVPASHSKRGEIPVGLILGSTPHSLRLIPLYHRTTEFLLILLLPLLDGPSRTSLAGIHYGTIRP